MESVDVAARPTRSRATIAGLGAVAVAVWGLVAWPLVSAWVANAQSAPQSAAVDATVGGCFDLTADVSGPGLGIGPAGVAPVGCSDVHDGEYYAVGALDDASYAGEDAVREQVTGLCTTQDLLETLDASAYDMEVQVYFPSAASWDEGDRAWACAVLSPDAPTKGSVLTR